MKKLMAMTCAAGVLFLLVSCATAVHEGEGVSLAEAIEGSAEKICADLPAGSRVAIAAWESPSAGFSEYIMEELTGALVDRGMEVADRQNLEYVYRELGLHVSGDVSDESARSIGKFLGADLVITGQLTELGGPYRYRASAVHVESATRGSVTRLDVRGDAALRRLVAALARPGAAVKTASYGEGGDPRAAVPQTAVPRTAGAFLDRGILLASRGEFETAIEDFTEAIKLAPNLSAAYLLRGRALYASVSYVTSVGENFSSVGTYARGGDPSAQQVYEKAIADFTQAVRFDPNAARAYSERGWVYFLKRDNDRAVADCSQAIRLDPDFVRAYTNRAVAYMNKGDIDRAIEDCSSAIRLDPNDATAYCNRGAAHSVNGDHELAITDLTQAIRFKPDDVGAYIERGVAYFKKGESDRAIADYNQAIMLDPNCSIAYNNRGWTYYYKGDDDRAIADYTQAIRLDPNYVTAYNNRSQLYNDNGDYNRAIADYTEVIRLYPDSAETYYIRGIAYQAKGDLDRAIEDYEAALRIEPNYTDARTALEAARRARGR